MSFDDSMLAIEFILRFIQSYQHLFFSAADFFLENEREESVKVGHQNMQNITLLYFQPQFIQTLVIITFQVDFQPLPPSIPTPQYDLVLLFILMVIVTRDAVQNVGTWLC